MRALRLLALAAAMVVPAAAAHAQVGVYVGPSVGYGYYAPHFHHRVYARPYYTGPGWYAPPVYGYHHAWHGYRGWGRDRRW